MPDGTQVNFPDDMPSEQIKGLIANKFPEVSKQAEQGFLGNVADSLGKRYDKSADIVNATANGQQTALEAMPQLAGQAVGAAGDVIGQGIVSAAKTGYEALPQSFQDRQKLGLETLANTDTGKKALEIAKAYDENLNTFNEQNPRAGRNFEAIRNLGALVPIPGTGGSAAGLALNAAKDVGNVAKLGGYATKEIAGKVGQGAEDIARDALNIKKASPMATFKEVRDVSSQRYADSAAQGAKLEPNELMGKFTQDIKKSIIPNNELERRLLGDTEAVKVVNLLDEFQNETMDMPRIDALDKLLTRKANESWKEGRPTPDTRDILKIQSQFRDSIDAAKPQQGLESWKAAKNDFSISRKLEDINDIFEHAKKMPNEATAIQAGFRNLSEDASRMRGYNPTAQKYINDAATNDITVDTLKTLGSRLIPIVVGGAGGGIGATLAATAGSMASRGLAASVKVRQGNKVAREVLKGFKVPKLVPKEEKALIQEIRLLPAPDKVTIVDSQGRARTMTAAERQAAQASRERALEIGLTPDVRKVQRRNELNKLFDRADEQKRLIKEAQVEDLYKKNKISLKEMLEYANRNATDRAQAIGTNPQISNIGRALEAAMKKKNNK